MGSVRPDDQDPLIVMVAGDQVVARVAVLPCANLGLQS